MKTLLTLFITALLAVPTMAQSRLNSAGGNLGGGGGGAPAEKPSVDKGAVLVGSFWFESARFKNAIVEIKSLNTIQFTETDKSSGQRPIALPWARVPQAVQGKLAQAMEKFLAAEKAKADGDAAKDAARAELKKAGFEWIFGEIISHTPTGFLVSAKRAGDRKEDLIVHVVGKTDKADGEKWDGQCKRDGLYEYISVLSARSMVRNYVQP